MIKLKRSLKKAKNAVSDIIGNLLILAITVTLFSSVLFFVTSMPMPQTTTYAEMQFNQPLDPNTAFWVNLTHKGGQELKNESTRIIIYTNDVAKIYSISNSTPSIGNTWSTGQTWCVKLLGTDNAGKKISVMIVNTETNNIVWQSDINGGSSGFPPIIGNKGTTPMPAIAENGMTFKAYVTDPDGDLLSVKVNITNLIPNEDDLTMTPDSTGIYTSTSIDAKIGWAGKYVEFVASDSTGKVTKSRLYLSVVENNGGTPTDSNGTIGAPPGDLFYSQFEGINTFKLSDWKSNGYNATPTSQFIKGVMGTVVVASKFLVNTDTINNMMIIDPVTNLIVTSASSPTFAFQRYDYTSGYYIYNATIDTQLLTTGKEYLLQVELRDSWFPNNNVFFATLTIKIGSVSLPLFETFSDAAYSKHTSNFNSSDIIYVKVTNNLGGLYQSGGLVEICDFHYDMQIKRIPGSVSDPQNPVSSVTRNLKEYNFTIDLSLANQDPWLPGLNSYMLKFDTFNSGASSTLNAESYLLVKFLNITAPRLILDLVAGYPSSTKGGWGDGSIMAYYQNENQWSDPDIIQAISNKHQAAFGAATLVTLGSINNNGKNDIIAVMDSTTIVAYLNNGYWSIQPIAETGKTVTAIKAAPVGYSGSDDVIVGFSDGSWGIYWNDGLWTYQGIGSAISNTKVTAIETVDTKNTTGLVGTLKLMDIVVGYSNAKGIAIYSNPGGQNKVWTASSWTGGTPSLSQHSATSETSYNGTIKSGTNYLDTITGTSYEQLNEIMGGAQSFNSNPANPAPFILPMTITELSSLVTTNWDPSPVASFTSASLHITYSYDKWYDFSSPVKLNGNPTGYFIQSGVTSLTIPLSGITTNAQLQAATLQVTNGDGKGTFTITSWYVTVSYPSQMVLEHGWGFVGVERNMQNTFTVTANTSIDQHDNFEFKWSIDGGVTYNSFVDPIIVSSSTRTTYTSAFDALPGTTGTTGQVYIKVFSKNPLNPNLELIQISYMKINTTVVTAGSMASVVSIKSGDMNNDGWDDIVVCDSTNVWVLKNKAGAGLFTSTGQIDKPLTTWVNQIISMGIGPAKGSKVIKDIVIASSSAVFIIDQTSIGTYAVSPIASGISLTYTTIKDMAVGDVDGNGYVDVVIAYDGETRLDLFRNNGSNFMKWFIGDAPNDVNCICLGKFQNK